MEGIGATVHEWVSQAATSANQTSRRAGVSASTLSRVLNDQVDPSVGTLREIALACGVDLHLESHPVSDPDAARAARSSMESDYPPIPLEVEAWVRRLDRFSDDPEDPVSVISTAARYASPLNRTGALLFRGAVPLGQVASAGAASGGQWALSGAAGMYLPRTDEVAPTATILWCTEPRRASQIIADSPLRATDRPDKATVAVIGAETELFTGAFTQGIITYAAPIQIMLDCLSMSGQVFDDALTEVKSW